MKKVIFIFCLILFAVSSKAACTIDTIYAYTFITGTSIKEYNSRFIYTHDANGNEMSVITQNWDVANNTWKNIYKNLYSYDSQNQKKQKTLVITGTQLLIIGMAIIKTLMPTMHPVTEI